MNEQYVKVCYQKKDEPGVFGMQAYTYKSAIPLKIGDIVIAPTRYGGTIARVYELNVPDGQVDTRWEIKTIEKLYDSKAHLCDTCSKEYATCGSNPAYGDSETMDNVSFCTMFVIKTDDAGVLCDTCAFHPITCKGEYNGNVRECKVYEREDSENG